MSTIENDATFSHRVDVKDIIISVSENWQSFAVENYGGNSCLPENIIGTSLWNHIRDRETRHLYEIILQKVRRKKRLSVFSFRCDAPEKRRFLKLKVIPREDGSVDFISQIVKVEHRETVHLLRTDIERSNEFLRICSMCKKIATGETKWEEVEIALHKLKLFEKDVLPQFTHSVCKTCYDAMMEELER